MNEPNRPCPEATKLSDCRVLLSAYQCGPGMGSVSQIGWEWYRRLSRRVRVTLVTHVRNRLVLTRAGAPIANSEIIFIDTEWFAGPLYRSAKRLFPRSDHMVFTLSGLDFYIYDFVAVRTLKRRLAAGERWDLTHAVTPVTTAAATRLHRLGMPVIKGPLNNGIANPRGFRPILRDDYTWLAPLRNLARVADAIAGSTRNAAIILTATRATVATIPRRYRSRCIKMLENAVDPGVFAPAPWPPQPSSHQPLSVLFVGRLTPVKALTLLLQALARVRDEFRVELTVVGEGPMGAVWRAEAFRLGISEIVQFVGARNLGQVAAAMRAAHVVCLPSVRESGGAVLLEAMASARPVIAVGFGGPAEIIDEAVGVAVPPTGMEGVVAGLVQAFRDILRNPEAWRRRGEEGRRRAEERFGWDANINRAIELYGSLLQSRGAPPSTTSNTSAMKVAGE